MLSRRATRTHFVHGRLGILRLLVLSRKLPGFHSGQKPLHTIFVQWHPLHDHLVCGHPIQAHGIMSSASIIIALKLTV